MDGLGARLGLVDRFGDLDRRVAVAEMDGEQIARIIVDRGLLRRKFRSLWKRGTDDLFRSRLDQIIDLRRGPARHEIALDSSVYRRQPDPNET